MVQEMADGVAWLPLGFVNVYMVGRPGNPWTLVDTGMPYSVGAIRRAAMLRYGASNPPQAIVLTHAHVDHVGSALALARAWNVPVYVHPLEMPYVTGQSDYPPADPTVGGFIGFVSRFLPIAPTHLEEWVRELPADGSVPSMEGWEWLHTPGHAPGHVSLFRPADATLLAGDAFATLNMASALSVAFKIREVSLPPPPFNYDWQAARRSVTQLAKRKPYVVGAGHGQPLAGPNLAGILAAFADNFSAPSHGRYVLEPAYADARGVESVPPPVPDPLPRQAAAIGALLVAAFAVSRALKRSRHEEE